MAKEADDKKAAGGGKKKLLIIVLIVVVLLLIGGGIGAYFLLSGEDPQFAAEGEANVQEQQVGQVGPMVSIESFIVNILDDEQSRYLKAAITLEADSEAAVMELNQRMPQIKDAILLLVGNKTFAELSDLQGKLQLRAELLNKINSILVQGKVRRIYFTDFVVQ